MEYYDKAYDRVTTRSERRLQRVNRIFHKVTTTDDPTIRQVSFNRLKMYLHGYLFNGIFHCYSVLVSQDRGQRLCY